MTAWGLHPSSAEIDYAVARSFVDRNGTYWEVWETTPSTPTLIAPEMAEGWLTFASDIGRRRLFPVPKDWAAASDERLELMSRAAVSTGDDRPEQRLRDAAPRDAAP